MIAQQKSEMLSEYQDFNGRGLRGKDREIDIREFQERKFYTFEKFCNPMIAGTRQVLCNQRAVPSPEHGELRTDTMDAPPKELRS